MRAVTQASFGGPEQLKIDSIDKPIPAAGQVLVRVIATSVNRPDIIQRQGNYPPPPGDSEVLGLEIAGEVAEVGRGRRCALLPMKQTVDRLLLWALGLWARGL